MCLCGYAIKRELDKIYAGPDDVIAVSFVKKAPVRGNMGIKA